MRPKPDCRGRRSSLNLGGAYKPVFKPFIRYDANLLVVILSVHSPQLCEQRVVGTKPRQHLDVTGDELAGCVKDTVFGVGVVKPVAEGVPGRMNLCPLASNPSTPRVPCPMQCDIADPWECMRSARELASSNEGTHCS
jgi:hypothetical protein